MNLLFFKTSNAVAASETAADGSSDSKPGKTAQMSQLFHLQINIIDWLPCTYHYFRLLQTVLLFKRKLWFPLWMSRTVVDFVVAIACSRFLYLVDSFFSFACGHVILLNGFFLLPVQLYCYFIHSYSAETFQSWPVFCDH